jgi:TMEM175 potassium channel family protein
LLSLRTSSTQESAASRQRLKGTGRVEALSDGIFAIAMTLLVLEIQVPEVTNDESLVRALVDDWPSHLAFLIGFFTLLVCWVNHHYMFELINRSDGVLLLLNGFKLLIVSFTPFATAVLAKYLDTEHLQTAASVYTLNFLFMGLAMTCLWYYAVRRGLVVDMPAQRLTLTTRLYVLASILSAAVFGLSFVSVWACFALFLIMFGIFIFPRDMVSLSARLASRYAT